MPTKCKPIAGNSRQIGEIMTTIRQQAQEAWRNETYNDQHSRNPEEQYIAGYMAARRKQIEIPKSQLWDISATTIYVLLYAGWQSGVVADDRVRLEDDPERRTVSVDDIYVIAPATCTLAELRELWPDRSGIAVNY